MSETTIPRATDKLVAKATSSSSSSTAPTSTPRTPAGLGCTLSPRAPVQQLLAPSPAPVPEHTDLERAALPSPHAAVPCQGDPSVRGRGCCSYYSCHGSSCSSSTCYYAARRSSPDARHSVHAGGEHTGSSRFPPPGNPGSSADTQGPGEPRATRRKPKRASRMTAKRTGLCGALRHLTTQGPAGCTALGGHRRKTWVSFK